jgi:hypothetical protein
MGILCTNKIQCEETRENTIYSTEWEQFIFTLDDTCTKVKKWPRNDQEMTKKWPRNDQEMTNKWPINDQEMTKKWPTNDGD